MATSPRNRRALIIFGVVVAVAAAAFFLIPKATKKSAQNPSSVVVPTVTPSPSASPQPKASPKQVLIFSGRDPFDPSQGGGSITPVSATSPIPGSTAASSAVFVLAELFMMARRRSRRQAWRRGSLPELTPPDEAPGS